MSHHPQGQQLLCASRKRWDEEEGEGASRRMGVRRTPRFRGSDAMRAIGTRPQPTGGAVEGDENEARQESERKLWVLGNS